jgi:Ser/Thr protein kinase RdoA (MazF antagonist)
MRSTDLADRAEELRESLIELENSLRQAELPRFLVHGDYGPYNLLFRPNAPVVILDFEISRLDWRTIDILDALRRFCGQGVLGLRMEKVKCLFDAYQSHYPLTQNEFQCMTAVWKYFHIRRCIASWYRHFERQADYSLAAAHKHLDWVDWIESNQDQIMAALSTNNDFSSRGIPIATKAGMVTTSFRNKE